MCSQVLPCPLCCKSNFESVDALKISLVKVTNRPLICPLCSEMLFGLDKLTIHLFSHSLAMDVDESESHQRNGNGMISRSPTNSISTLQSPSSSTSIAPVSPKSHAVAQFQPASPSTSSPSTTTTQKSSFPFTNSSISCEICDFAFENQQHLSMHTNLVHVSEPSSSANADPDATKLFPCHLCNKSFKMKGSLRVHLRVVHMHGFQNLCKDTSKNKVDEPPTHQLMSPTSGGGSTKSTTTSNGIVQINDSRGSGEGGDSKCAAIEQRRQKDQQTPSPDQSKSWICDVCTKSFTTKYFLKKHKRLHTGEMPYACTICGKTFTFQQSYHKHLLYHSDEKPHVCPTCGRAFKELSTLHNHERIHSGEKPFKCETCGKCFRQRVSYLVHRRIHDGTMPYKCTACAKSFRYKVSQRTHKCPAQPPGQVVRQSGEFLQKLLQNSNLIHNSPGEQQQEVESKLEAEERDRINEMIDKSIEDMARGRVEKINDLFPTPIVEEILGIPAAQEGSVNSPSEQFQSLCLYSHDRLDVLDEDSINDLIYTTHM